MTAIGLKINDKQFSMILDRWIKDGDEWAWHTLFKIANKEIEWIHHPLKRDELGRFKSNKVM